MELNVLNTKAGADRGAFLHLKHPVYGHLLYTGEGAAPDGQLHEPGLKHEPVGVRVRGAESQTVQAELRKFEKATMTSNDAEAEDRGLNFCCALVIEFIGLTANGEPLQATTEAKRQFFSASGDFVSQVIAFAKERSNFFRPAEKG